MKQINTSEIYKQITNAPEVTAAEQRLANVRNRLKAVEAEIERLQNQIDTSRTRETNELASAMLHGGDDSDDFATLETELTKLREQAVLLQKAAKLGENEYDFARRSKAGEVLQGLQPELKARQAALIGKYADVAIATREYKDLLSSLSSVGIAASPDHIFSGSLDNATYHNSSFFTWCDSLIARGLLAKADIPESLRKFWGMA